MPARWLTIALLLTTVCVRAEWVPYRETDKVVYYLETATIQRDNNFLSVWEIQDLKQPDASRALSRMVLFEYECTQALFRILAVRVYSDNLAAGRLIAFDETPGSWDYIPGDTPAAEAIRILCRK
jgi:hypothetical protein